MRHILSTTCSGAGGCRRRSCSPLHHRLYTRKHGPARRGRPAATRQGLDGESYTAWSVSSEDCHLSTRCGATDTADHQHQQHRRHQHHHSYSLPIPPRWVRSTVMRMCLCLSVCPLHISKTTWTNVHQIVVHVTSCGRGSVLAPRAASQYVMCFRSCGWRHVGPTARRVHS